MLHDFLYLLLILCCLLHSVCFEACLSAALHGLIMADSQGTRIQSLKNTFVKEFVRWHITTIRISRRKKILIFFSLKWLSPTCVLLVEFHFIFVTKDDVVIYLHENMRIKHLLLQRSYSFRTDLHSVQPQLAALDLLAKLTGLCSCTDTYSGLANAMYLSEEKRHKWIFCCTIRTNARGPVRRIKGHLFVENGKNRTSYP